MTRQFLALAALRFAKLGLAVMSLVVYGRVFGVGLQMDAWVFASGVVASVGMLAWGPVNEIARSRFLQHAAQEGFEAAARRATHLLRLSALGSAGLALLLWGVGPWLVPWLYAGTDASGAALMLQVFGLLLPALVLGQMLSLSSAYLNCCDVIYAPELIGIAAGLLSLGCVVIGADAWGVMALVVAHYAGLLASLSGNAWLLVRRRFLSAPWTPVVERGVHDYLHFAGPLYVSYAAAQANAVLERSLATGLGPGVVSSINYAAQIKSTLQAVITSVLFSLAVPRLTRAAAAEDRAAFAPAWREVQGVVSLFLLAVLPPIIAAAPLIVTVLFGTKTLDVAQAVRLAELIRAYVLALVPVSLYLVHGAALLARQRGQAYAAWGVVSQLLSVGLLLAGLPLLGVFAFPAALLVSHGIAAVAMARAVGPSAPLWRDLTLVLLALFALTAAEQLAFTWLASRLSDAWTALLVGGLVHAAVVGGVLAIRRRRRSLAP